MAPLFLDLDRVLRIHRSVIEAYGGLEGVRDAGLLHSAIAVPQASFGGRYLHGDLFEMAAAYLYHVVQNHPFIDGKKRVGAAAAVIFLAMNDVPIRADQDGLLEITLQVATGQAGKGSRPVFPYPRRIVSSNHPLGHLYGMPGGRSPPSLPTTRKLEFTVRRATFEELQVNAC